MSYNRINKLIQMQEIVQLYCREKKDGLTFAYVYKTFIWPQYYISRSTLYAYLRTPINKQLKEEEGKLKNCK